MANKLFILTIGALTGMALMASAADKIDTSKVPPASSKKGLTYDKDIKPIFEATCFKCHGPEKQKGKLRLDSLAAALKGGENGKSILPGKGSSFVNCKRNKLDVRDRRDPKFEVRGSKFRKPRT